MPIWHDRDLRSARGRRTNDHCPRDRRTRPYDWDDPPAPDEHSPHDARHGPPSDIGWGAEVCAWVLASGVLAIIVISIAAVAR